jgi:hypothetical protein
MRYIDFMAQTLFILFGIWLLIYGWNIPYPVVLAQLLLGPWQVISCFIGLASSDKARKQRYIYFIVTTVYLIVLGAAVFIQLVTSYGVSDFVIRFYLTLPPWILAFYYYLITWRIAFPADKKSGINF